MATITEILTAGGVLSADDVRRLLRAVAEIATRAAAADRTKEFCGAIRLLLKAAHIEQRARRRSATRHAAVVAPVAKRIEPAPRRRAA